MLSSKPISNVTCCTRCKDDQVLRNTTYIDKFVDLPLTRILNNQKINKLSWNDIVFEFQNNIKIFW